MSSPRTQLAKLLNVSERDLEFLTVLDESALARLHEDVLRARDEHAMTLKRAMEQALDQLPRLLRMPIRKLFGL
jgi:hypothetical protein